jgi:hypothetical protein
MQINFESGCGHLGAVMMKVWPLLMFAAAVAQETPDDTEHDPDITDTPASVSENHASTPADDNGPSDGDQCEATTTWWQRGQWTGQYRLVGENVSVAYTVEKTGNIVMQLDLHPLAENRYSIADVQWDELDIKFSKSADTNCVLARPGLDAPFEGHCYDNDEAVVVPYISMRQTLDEETDCEY